MSCPRHQWYFEEMRKPQLVCDNSLANAYFKAKKEKEKR
jgi:hypothetical protein